MISMVTNLILSFFLYFNEFNCIFDVLDLLINGLLIGVFYIYWIGIYTYYFMGFVIYLFIIIFLDLFIILFI
jgi:hypothetical protein